MCGIAGILGKDATKGLLDLMLQQQLDRGPDGQGEFLQPQIAIGMRRLSIIDLEGGWQPLTSRGGAIQAFQNGEIYNYRELQRILKAHGYKFLTQSDTEILAHGYDLWGIDGLLRRLDGMFAIAIFDRDTRTLHIARDRFGEKPLFYVSRRDKFSYASSLKSLGVDPDFDDQIDKDALADYLTLHYTSGSRTIFKSVKRLCPGCLLSVSLDTLVPRVSKYYQTNLTYPATLSQRKIDTQVAEAVSSRLVADVPVGVFLSGGIDSSIIAAIASQKNPQINTYSIGFPGMAGNEAPHAEAVAAHLKTTHKTYNFDGSKFKELVPMVASALDEPLGDQAMLPLYWLCKEASKEVKVVLSGEGGDELFAGYGYYLPFVAPEWPKSFPWLTEHPERVAPRLLGEPETASGFPILAGQKQIDELIEGYRPHAPNEWHSGLEQWLGTARDSLQRACAADLVTWLPDNLFVKLDRIAMAHSLEGRAPFLSPKLVETALNLSPSQRIDGRVTKTALRQVARGLLPQDIVDRPKQGFVLPMKTWIKDWFQDKGGVSAYLRNSSFPSLSNAALTSLIQQDLDRGVERERLLFAIVMLLEWWKAFKATTSNAKLQHLE